MNKLRWVGSTNSWYCYKTVSQWKLQRGNSWNNQNLIFMKWHFARHKNIQFCRLFWVSPLSPTLRSTHSSFSSSIQLHQEHRQSPGISNYIPRFCQYLSGISYCTQEMKQQINFRNCCPMAICKTGNNISRCSSVQNISFWQTLNSDKMSTCQLQMQFTNFQTSVWDVQETACLTPISSTNLIISQKKKNLPQWF